MELRNNSLYNEGKTYKIMTTLELDVAGEWRDDNVASSMPALGSANSPGKPIVLHEDSFNSFLWKDPPMRGPARVWCGRHAAADTMSQYRKDDVHTFGLDRL